MWQSPFGGVFLSARFWGIVLVVFSITMNFMITLPTSFYVAWSVVSLKNAVLSYALEWALFLITGVRYGFWFFAGLTDFVFFLLYFLGFPLLAYCAYRIIVLYRTYVNFVRGFCRGFVVAPTIPQIFGAIGQGVDNPVPLHGLTHLQVTDMEVQNGAPVQRLRQLRGVYNARTENFVLQTPQMMEYYDMSPGAFNLHNTYKSCFWSLYDHWFTAFAPALLIEYRYVRTITFDDLTDNRPESQSAGDIKCLNNNIDVYNRITHFALVDPWEGTVQHDTLEREVHVSPELVANYTNLRTMSFSRSRVQVATAISTSLNNSSCVNIPRFASVVGINVFNDTADFMLDRWERLRWFNGHMVNPDFQ